jgi:hypothetical protein
MTLQSDTEPDGDVGGAGAVGGCSSWSHVPTKGEAARGRMTDGALAATLAATQSGPYIYRASV